ncbi:pseudaminic acid synthase [Allorhodopirellula solitaria]|uniref:Pseudaminic acid synthase n=1 Tax=Allorhodopirellula solitaria TaxID=2527987 RepID=A0A5C5XNR1_9BACT|nr:pseudaminic acid synthase [Allorhodopirellula solitaria]TWT64590.1 Pseudaminic acid synthase [Allorhodopirellula solitaria]
MTLPSFPIATTSIGTDQPPFVIAEMSGNHNQSLDRAIAIVDAAADAGAHAVKLQTYTADTMTLDVDRDEFKILDPESLWFGRRLHELYREAATPWDWHDAIFAHAKSRGIIAFSSPFDETAVDFLETLDAPAYKIASFELTDLPLIAKTAATGKPLVMSTGMATLAEIDQAIECAREHGCGDLVLLKCTSNYPATPESTNLRTIEHLRDSFGVQVGLSDHTGGIGAAVAAVAMGATVIEKHFTLRRADGGVDSAFSLEPNELKSLVVETERAWQALGEIRYGSAGPQQKSLIFRRSIFVTRDVEKGEVVGPDCLRIVRPGHGLTPKNWSRVCGRTTNRKLTRGEPTNWDMFV